MERPVRKVGARDKQGDFPGGPVAKNPSVHYRGHRSNPWSERTPHASRQLSWRTAATEA